MTIRSLSAAAIRRLRGLFRAFSRAPREGQFHSGSKWSWRGWLAHSPWVAPSRDYLVYVPAGYLRWRKYSLVVWLHGCKQSPEEFAAGTRIARAAASRRVVILLPRQSHPANLDGCWNWFDPATAAGYGEAAIVLAQIAEVRKRYRISADRVYVVGMSSGGALAAVLAVRHPDRIAGVAIHSGVPCGAASSPWMARAVLRSGPNTDVERIALTERKRAPSRALPVPALIIVGDADTGVHAENGRRLVTQFLALNSQESLDTPRLPDKIAQVTDDQGKKLFDVDTYRSGNRTVVEFIRVHGLRHEWSGGDAAYPFHSHHGPDATSLVLKFLLDGRNLSGAAIPSLSSFLP